MSGVHAAVTSSESARPRIVFEAPSKGRPSKNLIPASSGQAKRRPKILLANDRGAVCQREQDHELKSLERVHGAQRRRPERCSSLRRGTIDEDFG
jgi:hypothetical protein